MLRESPHVLFALALASTLLTPARAQTHRWLTNEWSRNWPALIELMEERIVHDAALQIAEFAADYNARLAQLPRPCESN